MGEPSADHSQFLKSVSIFGELSEQEIRLLAPFFQVHHYKLGDLLIRQGEMSGSFYVIREGFVNVTRGDAQNGKDVFICCLGPGDYFGEAALFHDIKRTANVQAQDKVEALLIDKAAFLGYLQAHPVAATRVLYQMLHQLFLRLDQTSAELQFERKDTLAQNTIDKLFK